MDRSKKVISITSFKKGTRHMARSDKDHQHLHHTRIMTITSGKGGVGKTNIVANLGYALSKAGRRVLIFDADLGLGNLDVLLGLAPEYNLSHVLSGEKSLADIIIKGPGQMDILPAASGIDELTALSEEDKQRTFGKLDALMADYDIMLIDTAAGISHNVVYFNVNADEILVVVTPEPTAITDAYALMKVLSVKYDTRLFKLVVNGTVSDAEADEVFRQLSLVADRFLDIEMDYLGTIRSDKNVKKGVKQQKIVSQIAPMTAASRDFIQLARKITEAETSTGPNHHHGWAQTDIPG